MKLLLTLIHIREQPLNATQIKYHITGAEIVIKVLQGAANFFFFGINKSSLKKTKKTGVAAGEGLRVNVVKVHC